MRIGVCAGIGKVTAAVAGLDFIESTVAALLCPLAGEAEFQAALTAARAMPAPVEAVNIFIPGDMKTTGPAVDEAALDAYVDTCCRRARNAGVRIIVFGSGGSRRVPEGFAYDRAVEQLIGHLKRWGPLAGRAGVTICLEPLHAAECNIVTSLAEGAEIVRAAWHPNIRLLADTYHMRKQDEGPQAIGQAAGLLEHVHVAERDGRGPLGTLGEDQRAYFRALKDGGYAGGVSIEAKWQDLQAQLPAAVAELRRQIDSA